MKVKDFMITEFYSIVEDDYLSKAIGIIQSKKIKGLLVFSRKGAYKGVISEEIISKSYLDPSTTRVKSLTMISPKNITPDMDIHEAAYYLFTSHLPLVPVFEDNNVVGILEIKNLIKVYAEKDKEFASIPAIDVATHEVITISENDSIGNALSIMRDNKITRLPVIDKNNKPVGMISLHDVIEKLLKPKYRSTSPKTHVRTGDEKIHLTEVPVKEIMNNILHGADPLTPIDEIIKMMDKLSISSVVLVEKDEIKGIITDKDLLGWISSHYNKEDKFTVIYSIAGDVRDLYKEELEDAIRHVKDALQRFEDFLKSGKMYIYIKEHEEKFRSVPLYHIRMRLISEKGSFIASGESWGLYNAVGNVWKKIRDQIEYKKEVEKDPYLALKKLIKEVSDSTTISHIKKE